MKPKTTHLVSKAGHRNEMSKRVFKDKTVQKLWECFIKFLELTNKDVYPKDFENYDLSKDFDLSERYDFEIVIEDIFFNGKDLIPDNLFTTIKQLKDFIVKNK